MTKKNVLYKVTEREILNPQILSEKIELVGYLSLRQFDGLTITELEKHDENYRYDLEYVDELFMDSDDLITYVKNKKLMDYVYDLTSDELKIVSGLVKERLSELCIHNQELPF